MCYNIWRTIRKPAAEEECRLAFLIFRLGPFGRYLLTGTALAVLLGLICRGIGKLMQPFSRWKYFTVKLKSAVQTASGTVLTVEFTDSRRMQHTVSFPVQTQDSADIHPGSQMRIAVLCTLYEAGTLPHNPENAADAEGKILPANICRKQLRRGFLHMFLCQLPVWAAAALLFAVSVRLCFPKS